MVKKIIGKTNSDDMWESVAKNYEFIEGVQISNSFIILIALSQSKEPLSTTQISEKIAINSKGKLFKVSATLKDSLEHRLKREGYVEGVDVPAQQGLRKPVKMGFIQLHLREEIC